MFIERYLIFLTYVTLIVSFHIPRYQGNFGIKLGSRIQILYQYKLLSDKIFSKNLHLEKLFIERSFKEILQQKQSMSSNIFHFPHKLRNL